MGESLFESPDLGEKGTTTSVSGEQKKREKIREEAGHQLKKGGSGYNLQRRKRKKSGLRKMRAIGVKKGRMNGRLNSTGPWGQSDLMAQKRRRGAKEHV